ncbi:NAD(P)-dependent alcohol dehydrogenase [Mycobacterium sp.]|uniref:NAD(P)-dependent alcohol dehydrogenase n=1 Tax=Mycobacterium sp. TaxID=1785 RepID=UPI00261F819C|nr:NAD(P)-dependent alcohol dehydrogenase [Mycobacterium sp.]
MRSAHQPTAPTTATAPDRTMHAIVQDRYGSADMLRPARIERPEPAAGQVLLRVHAAGLDRGTWHLMTGRPYLMRLVCGLRGPKQRVPGRDVAGTVVALGPGVTDFAINDEVYGIGRGTFAQYAVARTDKLARKPANATFAQAAAVPVSALIALRALRDVGRVQAGQRVLIIGASGGVGSYAVQLATSFGAEVTGVASTGKQDLVRSLGAAHVLDYTREDFADGAPGYDLIIDIAGNPTLSRLRRALAPTGTAVIVGGEEGGNLSGGMNRQFRALALTPFVKQRLAMAIADERGSDLAELATLIETGAVTPSVDRTYSLEDTATAMRHLEAGTVRGKAVITL